MEPEKTTVRRHFYHVLSLTIALADCLISVYSHIYSTTTTTTDCQLGAQLLLFGKAGLQAVSQAAVIKYRAARRPESVRCFMKNGGQVHC